VSPQTPKSSGAAAQKKAQLPKERRHFRKLLLANHFGTIAGSPLEAKSAISGDTTYEELVCIGYQPQFKRLEGVVHIKQNNGYSGGLCSPGSKEYVRLFVSTDGGGTWTDKGTVGFTVHDVGGPRPLEYAVTLYVELDEECCREENLVLVRGILSWDVPPGGPDDPVVWGNSLDATIQVEPIGTGTLEQLLECLKVDIDPVNLQGLVQADQEIQFGAQTELTALELHEAYQGTEVPQHRYLLGAFQKVHAAPEILTETVQQPEFALFSGLDVDAAEIISILSDPQGDTTFEELGCIGLDPTTRELVGVVDVKLSSGYSGGLCTAGSYEYVAFWVDWDDGAGWHYVGTTSVNVHDISNMPGDGLRYAVFLPFPDLVARRRPCQDGPVIARIRAVLSWQTPPSTTNPYSVPFWGNHQETSILLEPGDPLAGHTPYIETIGSMAISTIDNATGRATGPAVAVGFTASNSPFGGQVFITGHIANPSDFLGGGAGQLKYKIWLYPPGGPWTWLSTSFPIWTTDLVNGVWQPQVMQTQSPDANGYYTYQEDLTGPSMRFVAQNVLARWDTSGNDQWWVAMEARDAANTLLGYTPAKRIQLDNTGPTAAITITSGGGPCGDFTVGDTIDGTYDSTDNEAWRSVSFEVDPASGGTFTWGPVGPQPPNGQHGEWHLATQGMTPCGYVVRVVGSDWTIVNSGWIGWTTPATTGFCLKA
jgi:hypothetical protein